MKKIALISMLLLLLAAGISACGGGEEILTTSTPTPSETGMLRNTVYMMGRSVLQGWFNHWQWDGDDNTLVAHGRFDLYHRFIEGPDNGAQVMVNSVKDILSPIPASQNPAIFFKFCFIDFYGGSQEEADANLQRNKEIIDSVYDVVVNQHGYKLILGNALPRTAQETDQYLIANHEQYNQYLESLQSQHPGEVFVFDMYSILTDPNTGGIKSNYATAADDAHPNDKGYDALDTPFFDFLETNF